MVGSEKNHWSSFAYFTDYHHLHIHDNGHHHLDIFSVFLYMHNMGKDTALNCQDSPTTRVNCL